MISKSTLAGVILLAAAGATFCAAIPGTAQAAAPTPRSASKAEAKQPSAQPASDGERIFQQNCSRCHNAPESFPPSISGTIVRHMRVRANLSRHDEQELLKYLNP